MDAERKFATIEYFEVFNKTPVQRAVTAATDTTTHTIIRNSNARAQVKTSTIVQSAVVLRTNR